MKKKNLFKKIIVSAIAVLTLTTCMFSASAVSADFTETTYMDGQKIYGQVVLYPTHATATTYCELASAGKATYVVHKYTNTNGANKRKESGNFEKLVYNNSNNYTVSTSTPNNFASNRGALGKHRVQTRVGLVWTSEGDHSTV